MILGQFKRMLSRKTPWQWDIFDHSLIIWQMSYFICRMVQGRGLWKKVKALGSQSHLQLKTGTHWPSAWFIVGTNSIFASFHSCQKEYMCSRKILDPPDKIMALIRLFYIQRCQRWSSGIFWLWLPAHWKPRIPWDDCPPCSISVVKLGGIKCTTDAASAQQSEVLTSVPDILCALCLKLSPGEVPHHFTSLQFFSHPIF